MCVVTTGVYFEDEKKIKLIDPIYKFSSYRLVVQSPLFISVSFVICYTGVSHFVVSCSIHLLPSCLVQDLFWTYTSFHSVDISVLSFLLFPYSNYRLSVLPYNSEAKWHIVEFYNYSFIVIYFFLSRFPPKLIFETSLSIHIYSVLL